MKEKCRDINDVEIASCGLCAFSGDSATDESIEVMKKYGIDLSTHRARPFSPYMISEIDLFCVMTDSHAQTLSQLVPEEKIITLGISDPYGKGKTAYEKCAEEINTALEDILAILPKTEISPMSEEDIKAIARIEKECFADPWSEDALRSELSNENAVFLTAKSKGKVAGYIGVHTVLDESYIANVAVSSDFRRMGIASKLLGSAESAVREKGCSFISLEVRVSNSPAIKLYEKHGYISQGERKNFYSHPTENALIMTKTFSEE
jgi:ribosomal-protein-alanine N-acetyltransferase